MASQRLSFEDQTGLEEIQEEQQFPSRCHSESCLSEDDVVSGYSSLHEESLEQSLGENKRGEDTPPSLINKALTEEDATKICKYIGRHWRPLGRKLNYLEAELDSISDHKSNDSYEDKAHALLIKFIRQQGRDATKEKLAEALFRIGRRDVAEILIGNAEFLRKRRDQKTFLLLKETISICEDEDGILYLVEKLDIPKCEAYRKNFKEEVEHFQEELRKHEEDLKDIQNTHERQERQEDKIEVGSQLDVDEKQLYKMHRLASKLVRKADAVYRFQEPFILKSQIYDLSISLSALGKDLEERLKMLLEMTVSDEETLRLNKLLEGCLSLQNNMQENIYLGSLKDLTTKASERRHLLSAPSTQKPRVKVSDDSIKTRLNTMPKSDKELRELEEQTRPQKDPMEKDNVWLPDS